MQSTNTDYLYLQTTGLAYISICLHHVAILYAYTLRLLQPICRRDCTCHYVKFLLKLLWTDLKIIASRLPPAQNLNIVLTRLMGLLNPLRSCQLQYFSF